MFAAEAVTSPVKVKLIGDQRRKKLSFQIVKQSPNKASNISKIPRASGLVVRNLETYSRCCWCTGMVTITSEGFGIFENKERILSLHVFLGSQNLLTVKKAGLSFLKLGIQIYLKSCLTMWKSYYGVEERSNITLSVTNIACIPVSHDQRMLV